MNASVAKIAISVAAALLVVIPAAVHRRSVRSDVVVNRKGRVERLLLALVSLAFLLCILWIATPIFAFADYPISATRFYPGLVFLSVGLWLLYRSHNDLGANWSITLELRERHELVTRGIYRHVRHPMYLALLVYGSGQALVVPNWMAGPAYLIAVLLLFTLRISREEQMLIDRFGDDYKKYSATTKRLIPHVW